ncbi:type III-A CRISPR-associated RAMP protein Csm4 [Fibrella arboris]|uniref:type III-A CRISPR-associated RAMP protein Csm4 n=1 Tax=Fibrella arboris TaxID=3242486 RepID=UPI0035215796
MRFDIIRLHFTAPLHLSNARPDDYGSSERTIHSDTFTAAIFQAWATLGQTNWIPKTKTDAPGFAVSSLFPFRGGATPIYFLPKPYFRNEHTNTFTLEPGEAKKIKKLQFLDVPHFEAYLHQRETPSVGTSAICGSFQSSQLADIQAEDGRNFLTSSVQTRLMRPRLETEDPTPYYVERVFFRHDSGLWCLVRYDSAEARRRVRAAVEWLGDSGIGTDRAVGNGQFRAECDHTLDIDVPTAGAFAVNLSLFCPESHPQLTALLADERTRYDLVRRGGWLSEPYNTLRKRSVWMLREGALLHQAGADKPVGKLVDLRPEVLPESHPIWRDGRTILLPVNIA